VLAYSLALLVLAHSSFFALSLLMATVLGACDAIQGTSRSTVIQAIVPDHLRGRVSSFQSMLVQGGPGVGTTLSGLSASLSASPDR